MKVIDLLNKIANDKEVPKRFKYRNRCFEYRDNDYWSNDIGGWFSVEVLGTDNLNDEVEILDEEYIKEQRDHKKKLLNKLANPHGLKVVKILDEEDEFIDIEEIMRMDTSETSDCISKIADKVNMLIKNQKKIIDKLKEEGK